MSPERVDLPGLVDADWCYRQAARILLGAETVVESGDRVAVYTQLAEAWRDLADSIRGVE